MMSPKEVGEINGISEKSAQKLIWTARESLHLTEFTPACEIREDYGHITTGSAAFDGILRGGVSTGRITEVAGAFKSGKTCLAHTLAVAVQLPPARGGLNKGCAFIDTENTFSRAKATRVARRFGLDPAGALSRIFHVKVFSTDHQIQMVRTAEAILQSHDVGLLVIDSLMALFRAEFVGIGALAARQQLLNTLIHDLSRIAEVHDVAILVTNQVAAAMKGTFTSQDPIGGNIVAHGCHFRVMFRAKGFQKSQSLERTAIIMDAPDLPPDDCKFFITEAGVSDEERVTYPAPGVAPGSSLADEIVAVLAAAGPDAPLASKDAVFAAVAERLPDVPAARVKETFKTLKSAGTVTFSRSSPQGYVLAQ